MVTFPRKDLSDLIRDLLDLTDGSVVWDQERVGFTGQQNGAPGFWVELALTHMRQVGGSDDYRQEFDPVRLVNKTLIYGYRIVTVNITVKSNNFDTPAHDVMETLLQLLARSQTSLTTLQATNLAIIDFTDSINKPVVKDNYTTSESTCDFRFGWIVVQKPGDDPGGWIETVNPPPQGTFNS